MRHTVLAFVALSVTLAPSRPSFERPASLVHVEASRMSMACLYAIDAYAKTDRETLRNLLESALDEVDRIDRLMSHYRPESPLSRINREAARHPVAVEAGRLIHTVTFIDPAIGWTRSHGYPSVSHGLAMLAHGIEFS